MSIKNILYYKCLSIGKIKKTGIIIAENQENEEILQNYGEFMLDRQRCYGKIKISIFRHKDFV